MENDLCHGHGASHCQHILRPLKMQQGSNHMTTSENDKQDAIEHHLEACQHCLSQPLIATAMSEIKYFNIINHPFVKQIHYNHMKLGDENTCML